MIKFRWIVGGGPAGTNERVRHSHEMPRQTAAGSNHNSEMRPESGRAEGTRCFGSGDELRNEHVKIKHALLVSVALNLVALTTVLRLLPKRSELPVTGDGTAIQRESSASPAWRAAQKLVRNEPVVPLDWRRVESEDYREYIANLRAIGCPEKTIRDIILADVKELFASRCSQVLATNAPTQFWRANNQTNLSEEQRKQIQELAAQQREVLKSLIGLDGTDAGQLLSGWLNPMTGANAKLEFLPENKRQSLLEILIRSSERDHGETDPEKAAASAKQAEAEIDALLTPQERYEYDLRESVLAAKVRAVLMEMEPSEVEFRTIYDAWRNLYAASQRSEAEYLEARNESDREILRLLGAERFERYSRGAKSWGYGK